MIGQNNMQVLTTLDGVNIVIHNEAVSIDMGMDVGVDMGMDSGMYEEVPASGSKDPIMSSMVFVVGISAVTLAVSVALGIILAKRKIKKGFELYED